jgi:hypothetical protein
LNEWWEWPEPVVVKNGIQLSLKEHMDIYHVITGDEQKGTCKTDNEKKCMAWIIGLKFVEAKLNKILADHEKLAFNSNDNLATISNESTQNQHENLTEKPSNQLTKNPIEKLTLNGLRKILMENLAWRIDKIVHISYVMDKKELKDR